MKFAFPLPFSCFYLFAVVLPFAALVNGSGRVHASGFARPKPFAKAKLDALSALSSQRQLSTHGTVTPQTIQDRRQYINRIFANESNDVFGEKTRSIARYQIPDGVNRNLCPFFNDTFVLNYTVQAYQISANNSFVEIQEATNYEDVYTTTAADGGNEVITIKRPQIPEGYCSVGDIAVTAGTVDTESALLIKETAGDILAQPTGYNEVWSNAGSGAAELVTSWQPVPPQDYVCLGHVWTKGKNNTPPTDLIRCLHNRFVLTSGPSRKWDNTGSNATFFGSIWDVVAIDEDTTLSTGTFISQRSLDQPNIESFKALNKQCVLGHGRFPFCAPDTPGTYSISSVNASQFALPYAKLVPCNFDHEDKTTYGLPSNPNDDWEHYAVEAIQGGEDLVGYKHVGASMQLGQDHCLGSLVFGTKNVQSDVFIHSIYPDGPITPEDMENQIEGNKGEKLTELVDEDFVLLFPCDGSNEIKDTLKQHEDSVDLANMDGQTLNGLVNRDEEFGSLSAFGEPMWAAPHYCEYLEDPTEGGDCLRVEECYFEEEGCKYYDQSPCENADMCWSSICSTVDKLCGEKLKLFDAQVGDASTFDFLPRATSYGVEQDGPGNFLVLDEGAEVELQGNTWKAFEYQHVITTKTVLEFDFRVDMEAEGHAICLDEDLNEDVEIAGAKRCFLLAGSQRGAWAEVWDLQKYPEALDPSLRVELSVERPPADTMVDLTGAIAGGKAYDNRNADDYRFGAFAAFDNDPMTKWMVSAADGEVTYEFPTEQKVWSYSIIPSMDNVACRDPEDWTLEGSNDGHTFVSVDSRQNERFHDRTQAMSYDVTKPGFYKMYKLSAKSSCDILELAEVELLGVAVPAEATSGPTAVPTSAPTVTPGTYQHFKLRLGSRTSGPEIGYSFINPGTVIKYIAFVQDNDKDPSHGLSAFKNIQIHEEREVPPKSAPAAAKTMCDRRKFINNLYGSVDKGKYGEETRTILRYKAPGSTDNVNLCPRADPSFKLSFTLTGYKAWTYHSLDVKYSHDMKMVVHDESGSGLTIYRVEDERAKGWYRLGDVIVGYYEHISNFPGMLVKSQRGYALASPRYYSQTKTLQSYSTRAHTPHAPKNGDVRLGSSYISSYSGYSSDEKATSIRGRLEVYYGGRWGTVCDDEFTHYGANVACRQLGYTGGYAISSYGGGSGPILLDDVKCRGSEKRIDQCPALPWEKHNCQHSEDVGVQCYMPSAMYIWEPIPPSSSYVCLGVIVSHEQPSTDDLRCVHKDFLYERHADRVPRSGSYSSGRVFGTGGHYFYSGSSSFIDPHRTRRNDNTIVNSNVFKSHDTYYMYEIRNDWFNRGRGRSTFPFFTYGSMYAQRQSNSKEFTLPYVQLEPCSYEQEDKTSYGQQNENDAWEDYAVELYKGNAGFVGYKHVGASKIFGEPYCLGKNAFGGSTNNPIVQDFPVDTKYVSGLTEMLKIISGTSEEFGSKLSSLIDLSKDVFFLFPCSRPNEVQDFRETLKQAAIRYDDKDTFFGFTSTFDVGSAAALGQQEIWSKPHYCPCEEEPTPNGGCKKLDVCSWVPSVCPANSACSPDGTSCLCSNGFISELEGAATLYTSNPEDNCIPTALSDLQNVTGESFTINIDNSKNFTRFHLNLTRPDGISQDRPPQIVQETTIDASEGNIAGSYLQYKFAKLVPGNEYTAMITPVNDEDVPVSNANTQSSVTVTRCCCQCELEGNSEDVSGRPINFTTRQVLGLITFNFTDNSRCAEGYAFTRSKVMEEFMDNSDESLKVAFTPNYPYYPKTKCGMAAVLPGPAASDDLHYSRLEVGQPYRYCVRAVAQFYAANSLQSSDETCTIHFTRWQASLTGKITTEPSAGRLPIRDVSVSWELLNGDQTAVIASGSNITKKPGTFEISFDELHPDLDRDGEFPVRIRFSKTTVLGEDRIEHQFLCQDGNIDCTEDGVIVYLKHLTFNQPFESFDVTSVPVRGRVSIMKPDGCPIRGARVCLKLKKARLPDMEGPCVETDHNGEYKVAASIGTTVGVEVSYHNHTIMKAPENAMDYKKGMYIHMNKRYERNDFVDISKVPLFVEVAGGLCNKTLGTSTISVKVNGCDSWAMELSQPSFKALHFVPAHVLDVNVARVTTAAGKSLLKVEDFFASKDMTKTIDLRELQEDRQAEDKTAKTRSDNSPEGTETAHAKAETEQKIDQVRFQYNGEIELEFRLQSGQDLAAATADTCNLDNITPQGDTSGSSVGKASFHVLQSGRPFVPRVNLKYKILDDLFCSIVEDDIKVRITNKVGIDSDFESYDVARNDPELKELMQRCSANGGCTYPVQHEIFNERKMNAYVVPMSLTEPGKILPFLAGRPNIYGDFRKDLTVEVLDKNLNAIGLHRAQFVVQGDYDLGPGPSFALPTHYPIMVMRDPPGGLSTASYQKVVTSMQVKMSSHQRMRDFEWGLSGSIGGEFKISKCAGLGASVCQEGDIEVSGKGTISTGGTKTTIESLEEDTNTAQITSTWSYTTSGEASQAGRASDVMVTPNLNVMYHEVEDISFSPTDCVVNKETTVKFDVNSPKNQPAVSFFSLHNIENHQIPELEEALEIKEKEYKADSANKTLETQKNVLRQGLDAWKAAVDRYDETNRKAKSGSLKPYSAVAPADLLAGRIPIPGTDLGDPAVDKANRIQFSGGGSVMEYFVSRIQASEFVTLDPGKENREGSLVDGLGGEVTVAAGVEIGAVFDFKFANRFTTSHTSGSNSESETTIGFALGDPEEDDQFVVDVFVDPYYGTFVFNTVAGRSMCPHEPGTLKGEDPQIRIEKRPERPVLPDEPLIFELNFANYGESMGTFVASLDGTTNKGGLQFDLAGGELALAPKAEEIQTLAVYRGPKGYLFKPATFQLVGAWDSGGVEAVTVDLWNYQDKDGNLWIKYEEPCPLVEWAGQLKRDPSFTVRKQVEPVPLTVYNPRKAEGSFEDIAASSRLNHVYAWYRELGELEWKKAQLEDTTQIDFANIAQTDWKEDVYGYATIPWDIGNILALDDDGVYQVIVESSCDEFAGAPDDFNVYSTKPIIVTVDRVEPALYGKAMPIRNAVIPGEEVVMFFTESIDCAKPYQFDLEVRVSGLEDLFDKRNLQIQCEGKRLAFQFDSSRIKYDVLMGHEMTVQLDGIKDLQGNPVPHSIKFSKTIANLNLDEVSSTFEFTMQAPACSVPIDESNIKIKIAEILALSDPNRISIVAAACKDEDHAFATVKVGAASTTAQRRLGSPTKEQHPGKEEESAIELFYGLRELSEAFVAEAGVKNTARQRQLRAGLFFNVTNMKVVPGELDVKRYSLNDKPTAEEESIMAVVEVPDNPRLARRKAELLRLDQSVKKHLDQSDKHVDHKIEELVDEMGQADSRMQDQIKELDHKIELLLDHNLLEDHREPKDDRSANSSDGSASGSRHHQLPTDENIAELLEHVREEQEENRMIILVLSLLVLLLGFLLYSKGRSN